MTYPTYSTLDELSCKISIELDIPLCVDMQGSMFAGRAAAAERGHGAGHQEAQGAEDGGHLAGERAPGVAIVAHTAT